MKTMGEQLAALKDKIAVVEPQPVNKIQPPQTARSVELAQAHAAAYFDEASFKKSEAE